MVRPAEHRDAVVLDGMLALSSIRNIFPKKNKEDSFLREGFPPISNAVSCSRAGSSTKRSISVLIGGVTKPLGGCEFDSLRAVHNRQSIRQIYILVRMSLTERNVIWMSLGAQDYPSRKDISFASTSI